MLDEVRHEKVLAYKDDLLIPLATIEERLRLVEVVLELIEQARLKLNLSKCFFLKTSIDYLGHGSQCRRY